MTQLLPKHTIRAMDHYDNQSDAFAERQSKRRFYTAILPVVRVVMWICLAGIAVGNAYAQSEPRSVSICDDPKYRNTAEYKKFCGSSGTSRPSSGSDNSSTTGDAEAARKAEEKRKADEEAAAEAEQKRIADEKRLKQEADQKAFIEGRDEAARGLKGSKGITATLNGPDGPQLRGSGSGNSGETELRGSRVDTGIRTAKPAIFKRDFNGPHAAWKELFCAASILTPAIAKLNIGNPSNTLADYSGFRGLADEALGALNGQSSGAVPCAAAPDAPTFTGRFSDPAKMIESGKRVVTKTVELAGKLEKAQAQIAAAKEEMKPKPAASLPKGSVEDAVARQREINKMREEEAARIQKAQRDFNVGLTNEAEAKTALKKIAEDVKKAENDPKSFGVIFDAIAPETTVPKPAARRSGRP